MAAKGVAAQQYRVQGEHQAADADAEPLVPLRRGEDVAHDCVVRQQENETDRQIEEIAMNILEQEGPLVFAPVTFARLADGAVGRIGPERLVISPAIGIASESKTAWRPQNQERG